jgi:hypothetical protein
MTCTVAIPDHDSIVEDCLESLKKEFEGLSDREYLLALRTLDYVYDLSVTIPDEPVHYEKTLRDLFPLIMCGGASYEANN